MEDLEKKVREVLTQYLREELGNRVSQFSVKGLTDIISNEIKNYKPKVDNTCRPIIKETVKKDKK